MIDVREVKEMSKLYTTEEVAKILKYDVQTIRKLIREDKISAYKVGKEYRIEEKSIDRFIKGGNEKEDECK